MSAQQSKAPENKGCAKPVSTPKPKPDSIKAGTDQEKAINQIRQEMRKLTTAVTDLQKQDGHAVIFMLPRYQVEKINEFLLEYAQNTGKTISASDLISDALEIYFCGEEENKRLEEKRRKG